MSSMNSICRLCLQKEESISKYNIFDLGLSDSLYWIFGVEIDVGDSFSKLICRKCLNIVKYVQRVQKQFQTNQYILREKICPKDYDVENANATKDASTSTEYQPSNDRLSISLSTLSRLNRPYVSVEKLESDISKYCDKIGKTTYRIRKQDGFKGMVSDEVAAVQRISVPIDLFSSFPSLEIPKADEIYALEGYEKINDILYKELPKESNITVEERETNSKKHAHCDMISVPINIFDQFSSPYVEVHRVDQIFNDEGFRNIGELNYKKIPSSSGERIIRDSSSKKHYRSYYYNLPTSALKELIREKQQKINGEKEEWHHEINSKKEVKQQEINGEKEGRLLQKPKGKNSSLLKVDESVSIEVCKHCSQNFRTEELLRLHCRIRHNKSNIKPQIKLKGPRKPSLNDSSQIKTKFRAKKGSGIFSTGSIMKRNQFKKLNKLPSIFERLNSDKNSSRKRREVQKWVSTNHHPFENEIQETPNIDPSSKIPTESYVYQDEEVIWFPEVVGSDNVDSDDNKYNIDDNEGEDPYLYSFKNKLSSHLKGNKLEDSVMPVKENMDENVRNFIEQRTRNIEKTVFQLDLLKKIRTNLKNEIGQSKRADERYDFVMNFLSENNYDWFREIFLRNLHMNMVENHF